jgi:hypothetical protein
MNENVTFDRGLKIRRIRERPAETLARVVGTRHPDLAAAIASGDGHMIAKALGARTGRERKASTQKRLASRDLIIKRLADIFWEDRSTVDAAKDMHWEMNAYFRGAWKKDRHETKSPYGPENMRAYFWAILRFKAAVPEVRRLIDIIGSRPGPRRHGEPEKWDTHQEYRGAYDSDLSPRLNAKRQETKVRRKGRKRKAETKLPDYAVNVEKARAQLRENHAKRWPGLYRKG